MKNFKSLFSLLMALVMVVAALSGCGDKGGDTDKGTSSKKEPDENAEVFTIAKTAYYSDEDPWNNPDGEYGEAMREALAEIEGEYNIRIKIDYYAPTEFLSIAQTAITNGDTEFADIMYHNLFQFGPLYAQGLLYDLNNLEGLDTEAEYWNDAIKSVASFKDGLYGIGSAGLNSYGGGNSVYYNRDMVKSLGLEDPVELVRRGEWTWDKLREYSLKAVKDLNNDGKFTEEDRLGCTSQAYDGFVPVWLTAGVPTMVKDANGNLTYNMLSNDAVKALQKFNATFTVDDGMFFAGNMNGLEQQEIFLSGHCMFLIGGWTSEGEDSGEFEIASIPYPKYSKDDVYRSPVYHNTSIISVPATTEKAELIGKVLQILGEKTKDFHKKAIEDSSVRVLDRDQYVEMAEKYAGEFVVDPFNIMLNVNESVSIGTMRAIAMPIFSGTTYNMYTEGQAKAVQAILDEMFNQE